MDASSCYSLCFLIKAIAPLLVTKPIPILNTVPKVPEFALLDTVLHYLKLKFSRCQQGFTKCKSTVTMSVAYFELTPPVISSQLQVDSIYFGHNIVLALSLTPCFFI